jgi:hypothetical protein
MSDLRDLIERATAGYRPGETPVEPILRRARRGELRRRVGVVVVVGAIVAFFVASAIGFFEPPPVSRGPVAPNEPPAEEGSCDFGPWATYCPEAEWLRRAAEHGGFEVTGDTGSALIIDTPEGSAYLLGGGLERRSGNTESLSEGVQRGDYVEVSPHEWALWKARDLDRYVWEMQGVYVWMEVEQGGLTEETVLAVRQATRETPFRTDCPHRSYADLSATSGRVGDQLQVTGRTFGEAEGGLPAATTFVEVWWNLDPERHESAYVDGRDPVAAGPGPVMELVEWQLDHECEWSVKFTIPNVPSGAYEVVLVSFSGDRELLWGASGYPLGTVTVGE